MEKIERERERAGLRGAKKKSERDVTSFLTQQHTASI